MLDRNVATMAAAAAGTRLRPHVKAHKCTALAAVQYAAGHTTFTCATPREVDRHGAAPGSATTCCWPTRPSTALGCRRWPRSTCRSRSPSTREATLDAAAGAGIRRCLIDVNVGLPRCGIAPEAAGALADRARARGLEVRGVMGYEGHLMMVADRDERLAAVERVDGAAPAGPTPTSAATSSAPAEPARYDLHDDTGVTEVQAGSYALMDTHYGTLGLPFEQALHVVGTVISVGDELGGRRRRPQGARDGPRQPVDRGRQGVVLQRRARDVHARRAAHGRRPGAGRPGPRRPDDGDARGGRGSRSGDEVIDRWPIDLRGW